MAWRFIFIFCISFLPVLSQDNPRELRDALRHHESQNNRDSASYYMRRLGYFYLSEKSYDSSGYYLRKAAGNVSDKAALAECLNNLGVLNHHLSNFDSSIHYYQAAYSEYVKLRDSVNTTILEINLSTVYKL